MKKSDLILFVTNMKNASNIQHCSLHYYHIIKNTALCEYFTTNYGAYDYHKKLNLPAYREGSNPPNY